MTFYSTILAMIQTHKLTDGITIVYVVINQHFHKEIRLQLTMPHAVLPINLAIVFLHTQVTGDSVMV